MLNINIVIFSTLVATVILYLFSKTHYYPQLYLLDHHVVLVLLFVCIFVYLLINRQPKQETISYKDVKQNEPEVKITMTAYYSPYCKYSREFIANEWKRYKDYVRENWAESVATKEINCIDSPDKCKNINSYPSIIMEKYKKKYDFRSIRTVENLLTFTEQHLN